MANATLFCTATLGEMDACLEVLGHHFEALPEFGGRPWARSWVTGNRAYCLALTGVGAPLTLARLLPLVAEWSPSLIVNVGIAGAYPGSGLGIGDLVAGESECFGDLGMELPGPEAFQPLSTMPWADDLFRQPLPLDLSSWNFSEPKASKIDRVEGRIHRGRGCTVNQCTGRESTGALRRSMFQVDFESMEGAAVALVGKLQGIPVSELRSISNFASTRDMRPENIALALGNLGVYIADWLGQDK